MSRGVTSLLAAGRAAAKELRAKPSRPCTPANEGSDCAVGRPLVAGSLPVVHVTWPLFDSPPRLSRRLARGADGTRTRPLPPVPRQGRPGRLARLKLEICRFVAHR